MKKSNKFISIVLAVVMIFSASSVSCFAAVVPSNAKTIESLISNDNLAALVQNLLAQLNGAKGNMTGTVLKLVFTFIGEPSLDAQINAVAKGRNVLDLSDEELAKVLLNWLDANLPEWTKDITSQSWWGTVQTVVKFIGISNLDLKSVNGILSTVYDLCNAPLLNLAGDLKNLNGDALKNVKRSGGDLKVIYSLFQWINDNSGLIAKFIKGGIGKNGIDIGGIGDIGAIKDALGDVNAIVKNLPTFLKSYLYLLVDGYATPGDINKDPAGDWGKSAYKNYTADQLLAVALIRVINNNDDAVSQAEADAALQESFYGLISKYGKTLYTRFAVSALNNDFKNFLKQLEQFEDTKDIFNYNYQFTDTSFDEAFKGADETGVLGQLNNVICIALKTMLSDSAYKAIAPIAGSNDNLNENIAKACRYVLPILANHSSDLGFDFSKFTAEAVADMELSEMAVAVLKIFFPGWFHANYNADLVNNSNTIAQLAVDALYFVVNNTSWITLTNSFSAAEFTKNITPATIGKMSDAECIEVLVSIGSKLGAYTLDNVSYMTHYELDKTASANWTWREYCDDIVDWALAFIKGIPAVSVTAKLGGERNIYDGNGPFYKVNVVLNELIDFAFLSNVGDATFKLDTETLIFDTLIDNILNFDLEAIVNVFGRNTNSGNILNAPNTVISSVIGVVDRVITAVFSHTCGTTKTFVKEVNCTTDMTGSYDSKNGHYIGKTTEKSAATAHHKYTEIKDKRVEPTCQAGTAFYECIKCGAEKTETLAATDEHDYQPVLDNANPQNPTCTSGGIATLKCSVCGATKNGYVEALGHDYVDGVCTRCGAKDGEVTPAVPANLGDVDGNGKIEASDARFALRGSVKLEADIVPGTAKYIAADVNGDGKLTADDARTILRLSVKLDDIEQVKANYGKDKAN